MNHTVAAHNVRTSDGGIADLDRSRRVGDGDVATERIDGLENETVGQSGREHGAVDDVVAQQIAESAHGIGKKSVERAVGEFGKSTVRGGEDSIVGMHVTHLQ